jgi:hypothetical protein
LAQPPTDTAFELGLRWLLTGIATDTTPPHRHANRASQPTPTP